MGMLNRRNAAIGWLTWQVAKRVIRRKARAAVPSVEDRRPNKAAVAAALAAAVGAVMFWRSRHSSDDGDDGQADGE